MWFYLKKKKIIIIIIIIGMETNLDTNKLKPIRQKKFKTTAV